MDEIERNARIMEAEMQLDPRTLKLFKAVVEDDAAFLRAAVKDGPDFELRNGAEQTLIEAARARGKPAALKALEGLRESMAAGVVEGLQHSLELAIDSRQMEDMITVAEETTLVPEDVMEHARQLHRQRVREEKDATGILASQLNGKIWARDLQFAVDNALESGRCEFEQLKDAKEKLAARIKVEDAALAELQLVMDYAGSAELALALVKAEESGNVHDDHLDRGWEAQVARVDNEQMVASLVADLVEEVVCTIPTYIRVWSSAFAHVENQHKLREEAEAAAQAAREQAEEEARLASIREAEEALARTNAAIAQAGSFTKAMFRAVVQDDAEMLDVFVKGGADLTAKNKAGMTLWQLVHERGAKACRAYLQKHAESKAPEDEGLRAAALLHKLHFRVQVYFEGRDGESFRSPTRPPRPPAGAEGEPEPEEEEEEEGPHRVCIREVPATSLPIVASGSRLLGGTPFSSPQLFASHQHEFSLSLELVLRDEWGGERVRSLLDRVRLPRGRGIGTTATAIELREKRSQAVLLLDATASDRRKLADSAAVMELHDLASRLEEEAKAAAEEAAAAAAAAEVANPMVTLGRLVPPKPAPEPEPVAFDFGEYESMADRLSVSRGSRNISELSGSRPTTRQSSMPGSRPATRQTSDPGSEPEPEPEQEPEPEPEGLGERAESAETDERKATLGAMIQAETEQRELAAKTEKLRAGGATLAMDQRELWIGIEREREQGDDEKGAGALSVREQEEGEEDDEDSADVLQGGWGLVYARTLLLLPSLCQ